MIALTALNLGPADIVGRTETYVVAVKLAVLVFLAAWGLSALAGSDLEPFAPTGAGSVLGASALLFTAYTGFNVVTNMAGSIRSPRRNVPLAVMLSVSSRETCTWGRRRDARERRASLRPRRCERRGDRADRRVG